MIVRLNYINVALRCCFSWLLNDSEQDHFPYFKTFSSYVLRSTVSSFSCSDFLKKPVVLASLILLE